MLAGFDYVHHRVIGQYGRDRVSAPAEGFAEDEDVGPEVGLRLAFAVAGAGAVSADTEQASGTADAGLDLVGDEEDVVLGAGITDGGEVACWRDEHARFALNGLHQYAGDGAGIVGQGGAHRVCIAVGDALETGGVGAEVALRVRVGAEGDDGGGAAVEVLAADDDPGLIVRNALHLVAPLAAEFDGGFYGFRAGVHGQYFVEFEVVGQVLFVFPELVVVESAAGEGELAALLHHHVDDARVAVALVYGRVGTQEVEILFALHVPDVAAFALAEHYGQGVVVVGAVLVFKRNVVGGGGGGVIFGHDLAKLIANIRARPQVQGKFFELVGELFKTDPARAGRPPGFRGKRQLPCRL